MYIKIYKQIIKINRTQKNFNNQNIFNYFFSKLSNFITPLFIILGLSPNTITILNFCVGLISCLLIIFNQNSLEYGIFIFFLFRIFDNVDGNIARYYKKTFFGKFLDATSDAIIHPLFFVSITCYYFQFHNSMNLLIFGIFTSIFFLTEILILDKFSSLVRWCNDQNSNTYPPYIRKSIFYRFNLILRDLIFLCLLLFIILDENNFYFGLVYLIINFTIFLSAFFNISLHIYYAKIFEF